MESVNLAFRILGAQGNSSKMKLSLKAQIQKTNLFLLYKIPRWLLDTLSTEIYAFLLI